MRRRNSEVAAAATRRDKIASVALVPLVVLPGLTLIALGHPGEGVALTFASTLIHVFVSERCSRYRRSCERRRGKAT
jgi:hypothetical protein